MWSFSKQGLNISKLELYKYYKAYYVFQQIQEDVQLFFLIFI